MGEESVNNMRLRNIPIARDVIAASGCVVKDGKEHRGNWKQVFGDEKPLYIEVGMGKGRFVIDMARAYPDVNFVGIERYDSVLLRAVQKLEEMQEKPENLRLLCMDARELPEVFAAGEVERIYLNFSDPWPKERHAKRRLTSREFLKRYQEILPPGKYVEFKTDNRELFEFSLREVRESGWKLASHTFDLHNDGALCAGNIMTEYEEKFSSVGNKISKLTAYYI